MGKPMILLTFIVLSLSLANALPIADLRVNFTINFPLVPIPTQTVVNHPARDQVITHVSRIMNKTNKMPLRYGKRSSEMSSGSILDYPPRQYRDDSEAYSRFSAPVFDAIMYRTPYTTTNKVEKPQTDIFSSFSTFPGSFPNYLEALMFRERVRQMDRLFKWKEPVPEIPANKDSAKAKLEKLAEMIAVMENPKNKKPLHLINTFYRTSTLTRARPGKRGDTLPMMQEFNGAAVFFGPMGKKSADVNTGEATVAKTVGDFLGGGNL